MRFIKKHKYKLLTLMLSIVSIFTLFLGINKTYAYTDTEVSRTLNGTTSSIKTIGDYSGYLLNDNFNSFRFAFKDSNRVVSRGDVLLVNIAVFDSNNNLVNSTNNSVGIGDSYRLVYNTFSGTYRAFYYRQYLINDTYNSWCYYISTDTFVGNNYYYLGLNYYDSSLKYLVLNIDITNITNVNTDYYYDTYYEEIETNYNTLLNQYNTLQDDYDSLNTQYLNLQQEVTDLNRQLNALRSSYNSLLNEYNLLKDNIDNVYNSGSFYYVDYVDSYLSDDVSYTNRYSQYKKYSLTDLVSGQFIVGGNLNIQKLCLNIRVSGENGDYVSDYPYYLALDFNFISNIPVSNVDFELIDFYTDTGVQFNSFVVTNGYSTYTISLSNSIRHITYDVLSANSSFDLTDYYLDSWSLICRAVYNTDFPYINSNYSVDSLTYNEGYYDGYNNGIKYVNNSNNERITYLENELSSLESQISDLNAIILSKNVVIEGLREQIDSQSYDYNLNDMIWTIASTPFESFKRIWNVDFFGVNIAELITGFITGLIVIWIIKKFF